VAAYYNINIRLKTLFLQERYNTMRDLQDYINEKNENIEEVFLSSADHLIDEMDIVSDFLEEAFSNKDPDFVQYPDQSDLRDLAYTFGWEHRDTELDDLEDWMSDKGRNGPYYFEQVVNSGILNSDKGFDYYEAVQHAQVQEAVEAIVFAKENDVIQPIIAAKYMQSQGYEKANEKLLDTMAKKIDTLDLSPENMENILNEAKEELGLNDKEVGIKHNANSKDIER
jgi:hypothetical protein